MRRKQSKREEDYFRKGSNNCVTSLSNSMNGGNLNHAFTV